MSDEATPKSVEQEALERAELESLREVAARLQAENDAYKALEAQRIENKKAAKSGNAPKKALALVFVYGKGRREIPIGGELLDVELVGFTEGVHYELK